MKCNKKKIPLCLHTIYCGQQKILKKNYNSLKMLWKREFISIFLLFAKKTNLLK